MGMTKFASRDTGYERVLGLLRNWIGEFETSAGAVFASQRSPMRSLIRLLTVCLRLL